MSHFNEKYCLYFDKKKCVSFIVHYKGLTLMYFNTCHAKDVASINLHQSQQIFNKIPFVEIPIDQDYPLNKICQRTNSRH